jgi:hypothetical protein
MPLQHQILDVPLSTGLDQKSDVRGLAIDGATILTNCVKLKNGAIRKRFGTTSLSRTTNTGATIGSAVAGGRYKNSMWMTDGTSIYSYSDKTSTWQNQSVIPEAVALDRIQVASFIQTAVDFDMAVGNGLLVAVFLAPAPNGSTMVVWSTVLDMSSLSSTGAGGVQQGVTAAVVRPLNVVDPALNAAIAPKVIVCGTTAVLTYVRGANLEARTMDLTSATPVWSAEQQIGTALSANGQIGVYDSCIVNGDATRFAVTYGTTAPSTLLAIVAVSTLTVATTKTLKASDSFILAMCAYNASYYIVYNTDSAFNANCRIDGYDEGTATILTGAGVNGFSFGQMGYAAVEMAGATNAFGWIQSTGQVPGTTAMQTSAVQYGRITITGDAVATQLIRTQPNVQLASRPIVTASGAAYFSVYTPSALQGTTYVANAIFWSDGVTSSQPGEPAVLAMRPVVTLAPRLQKNVTRQYTSGFSYCCPHFSLISTIPNNGSAGVYILPTQFSEQTFHNAFVAQPIDFGSAITYCSAPIGDSTTLTAGMPTLYAGQIVCEAGYCCYPEITASMFGAGGNLSAGVYQYQVTYEWFDEAGQIHRSAPSPVATATAVNNDEGRVIVPAPGLTMRARMLPSQPLNTFPLPTHIYAVIYRTTANGTTFYRVTADPPPAANAMVNGTRTLSINDTLSDAALTAGNTAQILYTTGGNIPNLNPPSSRCIVQHEQRVFLAGCDNPRQIWASKGLTDGESPGYNENLAFLATGAVRALASMDQHLIVFVQRDTEYGIEYVDGQGPLDTGTQSDWSPPIPIPSSVGAVDQRGVCSGPFGVLFRSSVGGPKGTGGIFLLSRDFQVAYIGKNVEDALASCPIVTSMVVHPNEGRVYITTVANDSSPAANGQTRIVWDYLENVWSVDTLFDVDTGLNLSVMRCGWVAQAGGITGAPQGPTYYCVSTLGRVYRESFGVGAGAYLDAGHWIVSHYRGALWKPSIGGFSRFWRMQLQSDSLEACDFTAVLTFDGASFNYYSEQDTWTAPAIAGFDRFPQVDVEMLINNQKARSVQLDIFDAPPTGGGTVTGQGMSWSTVSLELGVKPGLYRNIPDAQRA